MNKILKQVIESIRLGNRDDAKTAFAEYISEKSSVILSENYGDSDFEQEIESYVIDTVEQYYHEAKQLMDENADYAEWEEFVMRVAEEQGIYPEGEDDVHDAVQNLMRNKEMLGEGILSDKELEKIGKDKRNFVAKNMNKVNRAQTHTDNKNDYKRKPKHKKEIVDESSDKKRKVTVNYDNGESITTSMAATASDAQIKSHFAIGKEFNLGSGGKDKMAKVKSIKILESFNAHNVILSIYKKSGRHSGYVSQGLDKDDKFRRAKIVVSDIAKAEGINMSVEDKHITAKYIARMEG